MASVAWSADIEVEISADGLDIAREKTRIASKTGPPRYGQEAEPLPRLDDVVASKAQKAFWIPNTIAKPKVEFHRQFLPEQPA